MEEWTRTEETHRSPVVARRGMVASSQPLATEAGMRILRSGGNAADASIAVAAVLAVTEPCSTGLGGDCFALHFSAASGRVEAMNGSGRAPSALTIDEARSVAPAMARSLPNLHAHAVTVPGAAAGWCETLERWGSGRVTLADVLRPAVELAEEGFPVSPLAAMQWAEGEAQLRSGPHFREMMLADGEGPYRAPRAGEIFRNLPLASVLKHLGAEGRAGFYEGWPAERIVELLNSKGSRMAASDMARHRTEFPDPISVCYHGIDVYEAPPNGLGITALVALNILEQLEPPLGSAARPWGSAEHLHPLIEALRLAFADARFFVADPAAVAGTEGSAAALLGKRYAAQRAALIQPAHANGRDTVAHGAPANRCAQRSVRCGAPHSLALALALTLALALALALALPPSAQLQHRELPSSRPRRERGELREQQLHGLWDRSRAAWVRLYAPEPRCELSYRRRESPERALRREAAVRGVASRAAAPRRLCAARTLTSAPASTTLLPRARAADTTPSFPPSRFARGSCGRLSRTWEASCNRKGTSSCSSR